VNLRALVSAAVLALVASAVLAQAGHGPISGGAGGGGLPGPNQVTESMLKVVNACTDEYVLTCETTTGDFEWQALPTNTATATALAANGANCSAGSYPLGVDASGAAESCTVAAGAEASALAPAVVIEGTTADAFEGNFTFADPTADWTWAWGAAGDLVGAGSLSIDNLKLDGNTLSSTDTNGNIVLGANGTGQVLMPYGTEAAPGLSFAIDPDTGLIGDSNILLFYSGGVRRFYTDSAGFHIDGPSLDGTGKINGFKRYVDAVTNGASSPNVVSVGSSLRVFTNEGATEENYNTLPTAASGYEYTFIVQDSDGIRVTAATGDTIRSAASVTASGGYIESTTVGSSITIQALNINEWIATSITGTWSFN